MSSSALLRRPVRSLAAAAGTLIAVALAPTSAAGLGNFITTAPVVTSGLSGPIGVTNAGDGSGRLFVVGQCGTIRIVTAAGTLLSTPFLDLGATGSNLIVCGGEQGLLGLAFAPDYATTGRFYVYYTRRENPGTADVENGDIVISRFAVSGNPDVANAASEQVLLVIEHSSQGNHNGGALAFGPDGYLYAATGDGGGGGDPFENGQNVNALLGKVLRIDVSGGGYTAPPSNPFAGATPGADEVFFYGLRNPWRVTFDRLTGDLWIADVGQNAWEEVDYRTAGSPGGIDFGWDCREGAHGYTDPNGDMNVSCPGPAPLVDPVMEYDHTLGCSITGGYVFRNLPGHLMYGNYFFGDFCSGRLWRGVPAGGGTFTRTDVADTAFNVTSFGESESGRLYFTDSAGNTLQWLAPYTFADVPPTSPYWRFVESIYAGGVTAGCGGDGYCPDNGVTRGSMAVFLLIADEGAGYVPPPCTTPTFSDVPCSHPLAPWIEELVRRGVTAGCGGGQYCPNNPVTRNEMSVFLLKTLEGPAYTPPPCGAPAFNDVPAGSPFCPWVEELARRGVTAGCGGGAFCPAAVVNRAQMAVFLATNFGLPLP